MTRPIAHIDQAVFDYVKERVRRLHARFMMEVEEGLPTVLHIDAAGKPMATIDMSVNDDGVRLCCEVRLSGAGKNNCSVESNSWDVSGLTTADSLEHFSAHVADWVIERLQLVMKRLS